MVPAPVDPFGEDWFGPESQRVLAELAESTNHLPGRVVEVGSWTGRSTVCLARAVEPCVVDAVDTWDGSPGEISAELAARRDVFAEFQVNVKEFTAGNVAAHRMGWRRFFLEHLTDDDFRIRFLFIDATHTYREVRDNIVAALPAMVPGGVICGDDQHHPPVRRAVIECFPQAQVRATLWMAWL